MKKTFRFMSALILALLLLPTIVVAQQLPQLGVDKEVRIGKLPNGLTYYIRHNNYPKGQVDFYIAQKVGSVLENDDQRGLAHFLEHMCFNGTTHFPGKSLISWLESVGVKFGVNLNAVTGADYTIYNINNVPAARVGVQDSCLLILHDWANDLLLLPEEIDAERAVIHEEWRRSNVGQMRILEGKLPELFPGSPYGHRLPIGTMEVIDNFKPQSLRDYYEKWYRPDLQGIIVVGDIDVDRVEAKIKELFADIEMPENPAVRTYFPVPDTEKTIYAIGHDKEITNTVAQLMIKSDVLPREARNTVAYYAQNYVISCITHMLSQRLNDISEKPDAPFAAASVSYGNYILAQTKNALTLGVMPKDNNAPAAMAAAYRELLRASRNGFTVTEYERTRDEIISQAERSYNNRDNRENASFVKQYVDNFIDNAPIPSIEEEYNTVKMIAQNVPVEAVNAAIKELVTDNNRALICICPDNESNEYPTEAQFEAALKAVDAERIEAFKEELKSEPLIPQLPAKGKVVTETSLDQWGAKELTLSNGVKVILKHTDFKKDEISMMAIALNGTANIPDSNASELRFMSTALANCAGLGTYTASDLRKYLSGKQAGVTPQFSSNTRTISGHSTPKDIQTMMELLYMNFTALTIPEKEYQATQNSYITMLKNQAAEPTFIWQSKVLETLYKNSPRSRMLDAETVEKANRTEIERIAHQMTANAAEYTFIFVGNFDETTLRPLVEQYIATLPANAKAATANKKVRLNPSLELISGSGVSEFSSPMETPQTWAYITCYGSIPFTTKDSQIANIAGQILSKRLIDIVREKEGAVYSISAQNGFDRISKMNTQILTAFPMKPEMKEKVLNIIKEQFNDMTSNIKPEELSTVKEYMVKSQTEAKERNESWLNAMAAWTLNGVDSFNGNTDVLNSITVADVQNFMKRLLDQGNYRAIILNPEIK